MPVHPFEPAAGRVETLTIDSEALCGNLLCDPSRRTVAVYLPPGYDASDAHYPVVVDLAGFTGSGLKHVGWQSFGQSLPQRIDRLVSAGSMGPVVAVFPDGFTSLGGNQYIDSVVLGRWEAYLLEELLPRIEAEYRVKRGAAHRAVFGKSSGGYGAMIHGMRHGTEWAAIACHSGDMAFDIVYRRDLHGALDALAQNEGQVSVFMDELRAAPKIKGEQYHVLMTLAMAATYDPDPQAPYGVRLPVDPHTGELIEERWNRWLAHDPLTLVELPETQASLRALKGLFIDCGSRDQYFLHYGARTLVRRLRDLGIEHHYEEFDDNHSGIDYRMDVSLPFLYRAASGE
jgi:enterochelin esterase-like enzyme